MLRPHSCCCPNSVFSKHKMFVWHKRPRINPCCCGVTRLLRVRKQIITGQIFFSNTYTLQITDVNATGWKFAMTALLPFLWIGMIWASFHPFGTSPSSIDFRKTWHRIGAISSTQFLRSLLSTPSGPAALLRFRFVSTS